MLNNQYHIYSLFNKNNNSCFISKLASKLVNKLKNLMIIY